MGLPASPRIVRPQRSRFREITYLGETAGAPAKTTKPPFVNSHLDRPFLERVAREWAAQTPADQWHRTAWVLPSRRAERFLRTHLSNAAPGPVLAPLTLPLDGLLSALSGLRPVNSLDALMRFYPLYAAQFESHAEPFESYAQWGAGLLKDLNDIDRQGADPALVWRATAEWEALEQWGRSEEVTGAGRRRRLALLQALPQLHAKWHEALKADGTGTTGLIMRTASPADRGPDPDAWNRLRSEWGIDRWVFAGFNALTPCEEALFRWVLERGEAVVRFDADAHYLNDEYHEAGLYLRRFRDRWPAAATVDLHNPTNALRRRPKRLEVQGVAGAVGLAKTAGAWVRGRLAEDPNLERTAVVLADESLLLPMLHALPDVDANVTMGLPLATVPLTASLEALLELQETAADGSIALRAARAFLDHPGARVWLGPDAPQAAQRFQRTSAQAHQMRWTPQQLEHPEAVGPLPGLDLLTPTDQTVPWLERAADRLEAGSGGASLRDWERTAANTLASVLRTLAERCRAHQLNPNWRAVRALLQPFFREEPLDLLGEPLAGLQIMGLLETRLLDFESVLVVGANEGVLPPARGDLGWIPWSVRTDLGLPLPNEREAINAYHFYRLLQHPQRITLLYSTDSDATGGGEPSRYLHQLRVELKPYTEHWESALRYVPLTPESLVAPAGWNPSPEALVTLQSRLENPKTALSPSKLSQFLRDPEAFYREYLLRARPEDEPKERIDDALFGNIVHKAHELLYKPLLGNDDPQLLRPSNERWDALMQEALQAEYPGGQVATGKNALAYRVGSTLLRELANADADRLEKHKEAGEDWSLVGVEDELTAVLQTDAGLVCFRGKADRMERTAQGLAILDLKTGTVKAEDLKFKTWDHLLVPDKGSKPLQLMTYAWMHARSTGDSQPVRVGIVPLRQPRLEPMWLNFNGLESFGPDALDAFENEVLRPLVAALRAEIPWSDFQKSGKTERLADAE